MPLLPEGVVYTRMLEPSEYENPGGSSVVKEETVQPSYGMG